MGRDGREQDRINIVLLPGFHKNPAIAGRNLFLQLGWIDWAKNTKILFGGMNGQLDAQKQNGTDDPIPHGIAVY
jgi:hypothetical protein